MKLVKIGLIGCGMVTLKAHVPALMNDPTASVSGHNFRVTAICGLDSITLEQIGSLLPQAAVFYDYRELLDKADCEAVLIATGEDLHPAICRNALDAGKYVLCEKPLGRNTPAIQAELGDVGTDVVNRLQLAFNKRFHPVYQNFRQLLQQGDFGPPISGQFHFYTQQGKKPGWDGLLSNLIHYCELIGAIFGDMAQVNSLSNISSNGISLSASLRASSGAVISFFFSSAASWMASVHEEWQLVDDNRNRLISRNCTETYLFRHGKDTVYNSSSNSVFWLRDPGGYKSQLSSFYELASGSRQYPEVGLDDALRAHSLYDLIRGQNEGLENA